MDLRVEKTKGSIVNAFLSLRAKKPLEKITVKELCQLAPNQQIHLLYPLLGYLCPLSCPGGGGGGGHSG